MIPVDQFLRETSQIVQSVIKTRPDIELKLKFRMGTFMWHISTDIGQRHIEVSGLDLDVTLQRFVFRLGGELQEYKEQK